MQKNNKNVPDHPSSAPVADVEVLDAADEDSSLDTLEELDEDSLDQGEILDVGDDGPMLLTEGSHDESSLPAPSMPRLPSSRWRPCIDPAARCRRKNPCCDGTRSRAYRT